MNRRRLGCTTALLATVLTGTLGVAGCQGGGADFTQAESGRVRLGYPAGWERAAGASRFTVHKQEGGRTVAQLVVLERVVKATTADLAVNAVQAGRFAQPDFRRGAATRVEVDGADDARRLDYTYTSVDGGIRRAAVGTDVVAVRDRDAYVVRITGVKDRLPQEDVDAIVRSIELREA
jgi:hypothetical protein